jgi:hypothetical protein
MRRFIRLAAAAVMNQGVGLAADRGAGRASDAFPLGRQALRESPSDVPPLTIASASADEALT